jgi:hypothetical protein
MRVFRERLPKLARELGPATSSAVNTVQANNANLAEIVVKMVNGGSETGTTSIQIEYCDRRPSRSTQNVKLAALRLRDRVGVGKVRRLFSAYNNRGIAEQRSLLGSVHLPRYFGCYHRALQLHAYLRPTRRLRHEGDLAHAA